MRRVDRFALFVLFTLAVSLASAQTQQPDKQEVVVEGMGESPDRARQEALRVAVEQVVGVYVASETLVENMAVVSDKIYTKASGFAAPKEIISETKEGDLYRVKVRAEVSLEPLTDTLRKLGLLKRWKIMTMVQEEVGGQVRTDSASETRLIKEFLDGGYTVVDQNQVGAIKNSEVAIKAAQGDAEAAAQLAARFGADVIVTGKGTAQSTGAMNSGGYGGITSTMHAFQSLLELRAIRADTGEIIAANSSQGKGIMNNEVLAGKKAMEDAAAKIAPFFLKEVTKIPAAADAKIQLKVAGLDFGTVLDFEEALGMTDGVKGVFQNEFAGGRAVFEVEYSGTSKDLAGALVRNEKLKSFGLKITTVTKSIIEAQVK